MVREYSRAAQTVDLVMMVAGGHAVANSARSLSSFLRSVGDDIRMPQAMTHGQAGVTTRPVSVAATGSASNAVGSQGVGGGYGSSSQTAVSQGGGATQQSTSVQRSIRSWQNRLAEHRAKLEQYRADPDAFDNRGILRDAPPPDRRQSIIDGRVRHLENEIENFQRLIDDALSGE